MCVTGMHAWYSGNMYKHSCVDAYDACIDPCEVESRDSKRHKKTKVAAFEESCIDSIGAPKSRMVF